MRRLKALLKRHWPRLKLRTILFAVLLLTAILPALGGVFFRIYENTLVRQTEAELVMQGAALAAGFAQAWRVAAGLPPPEPAPLVDVSPYRSALDLSDTPVLEERPASIPADHPAEPNAVAAGRTMQPVVLETGGDTLAAIRLLDAAGIVVAGRSDLGLSFGAVPEVQAALRGEAVTTLRRRGDYAATYAFEQLSRASAIRVHHARPVLAAGQVVGVVLLSRSPRSLFRGLYDDRGKIVLTAGLIVLFVGGLAGLLSRSITRPIASLQEATRRVAAGGGQGSVPIPPTAASEIQDLFANFQLMVGTIDHRSRYIRQFAAAVSHEFKTPLTAIRGAIELLQEHGADMDPADRARFLANAQADCDRLARLVGRLLELARADVLLPGDETADLPAMLAELAARESAPRFRVAVEPVPTAQRAAIAAEALETVLASLLANSRQHGAGIVRLAASRDGDEIRITVADDGPGIPATDRERVFAPFFTTRRADGGTGLGLSIARALLRAHGGEIELLPSAAGVGAGVGARAGAVFAITLPAARPAPR